MHRFLLTILVVLGVGCGQVHAQVPVADRPAKAPGVVSDKSGVLIFGEPAHALFDDAYQFDTLERTFEISNQGSKPVTIVQALAVGGGASVNAGSSLVAPGETVLIDVNQPLEDVLGNAAFRYALITDEPGVSRYRFSLSGFVQSAFDPERPLLDFGAVDRVRGAVTSNEIFCREVDRLELSLPVELPAGLVVDLDRAGLFDEGVGVTARLTAESPLGLHTDTLMFSTNVLHQPFLEVAVRADVIGDIVPSEHPINLGLFEVGARAVHIVRLQSRTGSPFEIESVVDSEGVVDVLPTPCRGERPAPCWDLLLESIHDQPGALGGHLMVQVSGIEERVPLSYRGLVVRPGTKVKKLETPALPESGDHSIRKGP